MDRRLLLAPLLMFAGCSNPAPAPADAAAEPPAPVAAAAEPPAAPAATPSFDCSVASSQAETLVCADPGLAALDQQLATVYAMATAKVDADDSLAATQRGWIKGRDDCWKAEDAAVCVREAYLTRLVELTINYGDVIVPTPIGYRCDDPSKPFFAVFYDDIDPRAAVLTWGDDQVIVFPVPSDSGMRYGRTGVDFREHEGGVQVDFFGNLFGCKAVD